jgi:hypothetical protein
LEDLGINFAVFLLVFASLSDNPKYPASSAFDFSKVPN